MDTAAQSSASLPWEITSQILLEACQLDPSVAYALAHVSRDVCALTAIERFRTVILTSAVSLARFFLLVSESKVFEIIVQEWGLPRAFADVLTINLLQVERRAAECNSSLTLRDLLAQEFGCTVTPADRWVGIDVPSHDEGAAMEELYPAAQPSISDSTNAIAKQRHSISYPKGKPLCEFVENLIIDIDPSTSAEANLAAYPSSAPPASAIRNMMTRLDDFGSDADELSSLEKPSQAQGKSICVCGGSIIQLDDNMDGFRTLVSENLAAILKDKYNAPWSLYQKISQLPSRHGHRLCDLLREFPNVERLSLGADEFFLFADSFTSSVLAPSELTFVYSGDEESLKKLTRYTRIDNEHMGIRQRLRKVHVIGIEPRSPLTGVTMPFEELNRLRAGALTLGSYLFWACPTLSPSKPLKEPTIATPGVTHLRYDTRKFGFRPVEFTASKLRYFLREPCVLQETTNNRAKEMLTKWGVGGFKRLQLAWQVPSDQQRFQATTAAARSRYSGDWPRENKDVWTERSDRDLSPTFGHELVEAIRQAYGWNKKPSWESQFLEDLAQAQTSEEESLTLALSTGLSTGENERVQIGFEIRLPASLVRLEGRAAFDKEERIRLLLESARGRRSA